MYDKDIDDYFVRASNYAYPSYPGDNRTFKKGICQMCNGQSKCYFCLIEQKEFERPWEQQVRYVDCSQPNDSRLAYARDVYCAENYEDQGMNIFKNNLKKAINLQDHQIEQRKLKYIRHQKCLSDQEEKWGQEFPKALQQAIKWNERQDYLEEEEMRRFYRNLQIAKNYNNKRLCDKLRARIRRALFSGRPCPTTEEILGCSIEFFKEHIRKQFQPNMSFNNFGFDTWHIDHIIPCSSYNLFEPIEQKICFNWRNLRPMWAKENIDKRASYNPIDKQQYDSQILQELI